MNMKTIIPLLFGLTIFLIFKFSISNNDIRYLKLKKSTLKVMAKKMNPSGKTITYSPKIGSVLIPVPIESKDKPKLLVMINGYEIPVFVNLSTFNRIQIGDEINVEYFVPKYWGKPFKIKFTEIVECA